MSVVEPAAGVVLAGKYRLVEQIGVGGMSKVYRAENLLIGRTVAIKVLHPDQAHDRDLGARLFHEAQSVSRIRHPGIVDVLDAGQDTSGPFIVMEYLDGESVAQVLARRGRVGIAAALGTVLPVLDALEAAHAAGVIHRDLKPENVFYAVRDDGEVDVKLLDFGVAKLLWPDGPSPQTSTGVVFGTPDYLSPEQANGQAQLDGRSDLFAIGVLLFELLTNRRPFHAPTAVATAYKVAHARTPSLIDHGGPNDPVLDAVLSRVLSKRAEERHASAAELAAELERHAPPLAERQAARRELLPPRGSRVDLRASRPSLTPRSGNLSQQITPPLGSSPGRMTPHGGASATSGTRRSAEFISAPRSGSPRGFRSLPARFVGQCHVRGLVLRAIDSYVTRHLGGLRREKALARLSREHSRDLGEGLLQAIVFYDLELLASYLDAASAEFPEGSSFCRAAGVESVGGELAPVLRVALRPGEPGAVLRRVAPVCSRLFDFGLWEVTPGGPTAATIRVTDFEPAALGLRLWLVGVVEGALRATGHEPAVLIGRGDASHAREFVLEITTRPLGG